MDDSDAYRPWPSFLSRFDLPGLAAGCDRERLALERNPAAKGNLARPGYQACLPSNTSVAALPSHVYGPYCSQSLSRTRDRNEERCQWEPDRCRPAKSLDPTGQTGIKANC